MDTNSDTRRKDQDNSTTTTTTTTILTLSNIQFLVEGLDTLLVTNLDGEKRSKVIELRNELTNYINSVFDDYS
ncbi:MAG: hypothetical protein ACR2IS_09045 [Nitrososphaeraceae archaeon]